MKYSLTAKRRKQLRATSKKYYSTPKGWYNQCKKWAKYRNYSFEISLEDFLSFQNKDCYYCGDPLDKIRVDRLDNTRGYALSNLVPCCRRCNTMKMAMDIATWMLHMRKILDNGEVVFV